ncbi:MAG: hypothetical protein COX77_04570 [Candidatus Komeilibacteria bacterium CG_4_10_14_0_2_um_filter_37_10]|uniref:Class I SAM-dependent methyltransferase n=1 Tax=Candidatus Komeilibacteria bacterium CG_4_10_14_0_2_um_filter_37_10 TaxID=1974470 RepID=A0A2M7VDG5_9BACT|nr:MAG: hypothetical protein COX77_04570 [Candidatus Komeilibacteria bacterium CG_4_10_14_0_2_um_filter_37_10]
MIQKKCLFCQGQNLPQLIYQQNFRTDQINKEIFSARRQTEHWHYQLWRCPCSDLVFSSPIFSPEELSHLYQDSDQNYDWLTPFINKSYLQYLNNLLITNQQWHSALDIGCGNGFFLSALASYGFTELAGIEPSQSAIAKAGELEDKIFNGFIEDYHTDKTFDLITCFQTLDHVSNPQEVINKTFKLLKPNGLGYFIVHNERGLSRWLFGEKSPIYDVEHIYLFNKKNLTRMMTEAGFQVLKVFSVKNNYPLSYWLSMSPLPFKKQLINFFTKFGLLNKLINLNAGNVGIFITK